MSDYKFDKELNFRLVKGIEHGYSDYAEVRRQKRNELLVSGAYAWVKGNHIEDRVARELKEIGMNFKKEKAGYTWEYLSFTESKKKHLIIIKNANIIRGKSTRPELDISNSENYLIERSKINAEIDFDEVRGSTQGILQFLELEMQPVMAESEDIEELKKQYKRFYILTYTIDPVSRMLMDIDLWMPEFKKDSKVEMVKIDTLTECLNETGDHVNLDAIRELVHIPDEEYSGTTTEFDFTTIEDEKEEDA
ncbi:MULTISPECIES: hypothetical protein [unclassified Sporosarcina]|uniref:spr1630 family ClpXP-sensitive toxin n=1 Tax=unclassified Sporosarcina TaxID=2647733 RepID=UPI00203AD84D|nr:MULTISPECIES: hypothetical protein [unclassified Sporosarcina]GKV66490.1 hypothetical protein NCCP2331_26430 [Sporosarcina sp. NCCP-2331]